VCAKNSKPRDHLFILLRITITVSTTQRDDWGKQVSVRKLHTKSQSTKTLFSLTNLLVLLALLKRIFMQHTQKSEEAKRHRFLEKKMLKKNAIFI
jgi:hypothetical protein